ncbi:SWIM zinc finger family protein [Comamonas sp. Y33R10-2]|uniref:SWIM zinc finger family protein n=1 Tax=Comamonas sp. Y33R10-2 TaxID=2853257 RepID=UPI002105DDBA|nr:SWIM zinc finger family protein [Comamonas sp. Y33R10-2]
MSRVLATEAEVLALSPDAASSKAAKGLQSINKWPTVGSNDVAVWGECQGSGSKPYQTQVDLSGPAFKCSCPSRKFPCKHGLALMLLRAAGQVPEGGESPEWVNAWLGGRQEKAEQKEAKAAAIAAAPPPEPEVIAKQQAKRDDKRWDKVSAGMQELSLWMQDMVRTGLANQASDAQARQHWNTMAARMVDAQVTGMAARIKEAWELVDSHPNWARDLLVQLGHWQLLVDAVERRDSLSPDVKADVMAALGWPMDKAEVQALGESISDDWLVVGLRMLEREGRLIERRVWLQGLQTGRMALVLDYSQGGRGFETALVPGSTYRSTLSFYPGNAPLRAIVISSAQALPAADAAPLTPAVLAQPLQQLSQRIAANPLQAVQPLWCEQAQLLFTDGQWLVAWPQGNSQFAPVPALVADEQAWQLLALTGGAPITLFGEWEPGPQLGRWRLLSAWQADESKALRKLWQNLGEVL